MKKVILLFVTLISLIGFADAQNPQWLYYINGDNIYALAEEGNDMWVGTNGGVVKLDKTTGIPTFYNTSNSGLPNNWVYSITIDNSGTKWMGVYSGGLAAYNENGIPVSIKEDIATEYNLKVFPNPSSDQITLELLHNTATKNTYLTIYNINSQQLLHQEITEPKTQIDISTLPSGVYFVRMTNERTVQVGKFIKQ